MYLRRYACLDICLVVRHLAQSYYLLSVDPSCSSLWQLTVEDALAHREQSINPTFRDGHNSEVMGLRIQCR